jgi:hypothetical protein
MTRISKPFLNKQKLLITGVALIVVAAGAFYFNSDTSRQFSHLAVFPVENYLENSGVISQEDFLIDGTVDNVVTRDETGRRFLVSVQIGENGQLLPVLVESGKKPIQRGQRLLMAVHVGAKDGIVCTNYEIR